MTEYEVEQTVDRLSRPPPPQESVTERHQGPQIGSQGIKEMVGINIHVGYPSIALAE